ncbi:unnamed protein product [Dracunculus medinensis]|uniref:TDP43_N domain-containing protein n=1 Tax=Dracunculus medinensis TaxID=318479 RepID=A0A158Q5U3_DRAME|nr:unnamed protein product [Dracunculus medinensis]
MPIRTIIQLQIKNQLVGEPVEVELDDDGALLISALQSALPGASGLYFNENCKSSVKFDGKKLIPPAGGWKDRKYFATLGCRSFDYPFGTYANASKQFERSVNAVQRLFGNIRKKKIGVESSDGNLLPLEQQFVDLAAISTAKDNLIQQQREEIKNILEKLENKESQCSAQDEELSVLRNLGKEHTYMCDKVIYYYLLLFF